MSTAAVRALAIIVAAAGGFIYWCEYYIILL